MPRLPREISVDCLFPLGAILFFFFACPIICVENWKFCVIGKLWEPDALPSLAFIVAALYLVTFLK